MPDGVEGMVPERNGASTDPVLTHGAHAAGATTEQSAGRSSGGVWIPPVAPGHARPDGSPARELTTAERIERARTELIAQGLTGSPARSAGSRRLVTVTAVIVLALVALLVGSIAVLSRLSTHLTTTTVGGVPTTNPTDTSTTTTIPSIPSGVPTLGAFQTASQDLGVLETVGTGGQADDVLRTTSHSWITAPAPQFRPVVVYLWSGSNSDGSALQNLVLASSLEAIGGTFTGLGTATTSTHLATIDLRHATYVGPVVLESAEVYGPTGAADQRPSAEAERQFATYDKAPYTLEPGSYPFLDVGGHFVVVGAGFPAALAQGVTLRQLDAELAAPTSPIARAILGDANLVTATICKSLHQLNQPLPLVCTTPLMEQLVTVLPGKAPSAPGR